MQQIFEFLRTDAYVRFSFASTVAAVVIWAIVRLKKMYSRRCYCGCWRVGRVHQMIPDPDNRNRDGTYFQTFTFMPCKRCPMVRFKSDNKRFTCTELWWRRKFHPSQFRIDQELFRRAGLCVPASRRVHPLAAPVELKPIQLPS